jgi:hypothetical protein
MSQVQNQTQELKPEELAKLIEQAKPIELKYLLVLDLKTRYREPPSFVRWYKEDIKILYGNVEVVELGSTKTKNWDFIDVVRKVAVIPRTVPAVVAKIHNDDVYKTAKAEVYIFTSDGWKSAETTIPYTES